MHHCLPFRSAHPVEVLTIQNVVTDTRDPFGIKSDDDQYHLGSGTYKLGANTYISGTISVDAGKTVTIDLNGKSLDRCLQSVGKTGSVINVWKGGKLTIIDSSPTGGGTITGGFTANRGGGIYCDGKLTLNNVTIENNSAPKGGGIFGAESSEVTISGRTKINRNTARDENGGGIYLGEKAEMDYKMRCTHLTVSGGNIYCNSAKRGTVLYYVSGSDYKFVYGVQYNGTIY